MATWEWLESGSIQKSLSTVQELPDGDEYGETHTYDQTPPTETNTLKATGAPLSEYDAVRTAMRTPAATMDFPLTGGGTVTGIPVSASKSRIQGTDKYEITVTVQEAS